MIALSETSGYDADQENEQAPKAKKDLETTPFF